MNEFRQIKRNGDSEVVEKNSKFLAFAVKINSEEEAKMIMDEKRREHSKANHLCYAYRLKSNNIIENLSDDGEPTHSAGSPILKQIQAEDLLNTLVMVVRYFGGVKLGVGGLIKAYRQAAKEAIKAAEKEKVKERIQLSFKMSYDQWGAVMALMDRENWTFEVENHNSSAVIKLDIELSEKEMVISKLRELKIDLA